MVYRQSLHLSLPVLAIHETTFVHITLHSIHILCKIQVYNADKRLSIGFWGNFLRFRKYVLRLFITKSVP